MLSLYRRLSSFSQAPRSILDLDLLPKTYDDFLSRLGSSYPGHDDSKYMSWLSQVRNSPSSTLSTNPVTYYPELTSTWTTLYTHLRELHFQYACEAHTQNLKELETLGIYSLTEIPSFAQINLYLSQKSGFRLVNVGGMLNPRTFLNALAFGVFYSTQYIRHSSVPFYSPEPDIVHEVMGHVPLLADKEFAEFSREIGKKSLGASDKAIDLLAKVYFFSVEFGIVRDKVLGAGILGSCQELELVGKGGANVQQWKLEDVLKQEFTLSDYQPLYMDVESLSNLKAIFEEVDQLIGY